jgi:integrase
VNEGSDEEFRKSKATANRNLAVLKAILNLAYSDRLATSDHARKSVKKYENVDFARTDFLNHKEVMLLLDSADGYFHDLLKAGILTGARYGELSKLKVRDLDKSSNLLNIPKSKTKARVFPLAKLTKRFFSKLARNKLPGADLLTKNGTDPWGHGDQTKLMREVVDKAELPKSVVFYTLRHSFIADLINENMNVFDIAKITGTSIEMIDKHYGKLFKGRVIEVLERSSLAGEQRGI